MNEIIEKLRSHGPHIQISDAVFFLTWRLAFNLPKHLKELYAELSEPDADTQPNLESLKKNNMNLFNRFCQYDDALGKITMPGLSLNDPHISQIIKTALHHYDSETYELHAYCIMSNHLHIILKPALDDAGGYFRVSCIVQKIKSYTSSRINEYLGKKGQLWDRFYFDRIIRDQTAYLSIVQYVLNNPVNANLVNNSKDWQDSYFKDTI